MTNDLAVVFAQ